MPLEDVIRLTTESTAKVMGKSGQLGTLRVGSEGDVTLTSLEEGDFTMYDKENRSVQSRHRLVHALTIKNGKIYSSKAV